MYTHSLRQQNDDTRIYVVLECKVLCLRSGCSVHASAHCLTSSDAHPAPHPCTPSEIPRIILQSPEGGHVAGQGAGETGIAEAYMCSRIMRDPLVRQCVAEYQGEFIADASDGGFTKGTQWLVWKFESDSTLGNALSVRSPPWSDCLSPRWPLSAQGVCHALPQAWHGHGRMEAGPGSCARAAMTGRVCQEVSGGMCCISAG